MTIRIKIDIIEWHKILYYFNNFINKNLIKLKENIDDIEELCKDTLSHIEYLNNVIKSQQAELNVTRQFVHDKGLTFDLLNYSTK